MSSERIEPLNDSPPSFTCPRCGRTSHHPDDVREGYCGACHDWTREPLSDSIDRIVRAYYEIDDA
jgi:hypothetical protein